MSNCPEHGDLMRGLALGSLDDERALVAETVREECSDCTRWWNSSFSGEVYDAVDGAVAEGISSFVPPARRRLSWLATAAALLLAVGIGTTSMLWRNAQTTSMPANDVLSTWDFEAGNLIETVPPGGAATQRNAATDGEAAIFVSDLESGDLSGWSTGS